MQFEITYSREGEPTHVVTWDGFMCVSRAFEFEKDGWMLEQLDPNDYPVIRAGRDAEALVAEVNRLRRRNFELKTQNNMYAKAAGF